MNNTKSKYFLYLIFIIFIILNVNGISYAGDTVIETDTFIVKIRPEITTLDINSFISPPNKYINLKIDTDFVFPPDAFEKIAQLGVVEQITIEPKIFKLETTQDYYDINFNNVRLFLDNIELSKYKQKIYFKVFRYDLGKWKFLYKQKFNSDYDLKFFVFTLLDKKKYKVKLYFNKTLAGSSKIIDLSKTDEYVGYIKTKKIIKTNFKVVANDSIFPVKESDFYLYNTEDELIEKGKVDKFGIVRFDFGKDISLPVIFEENEFYRVKVINQKNEVYNKKFDFDLKGDTYEYLIITESEPLDKLANKPVVVVGRIYMKVDTGKIVPLNNFKVGLYEKEVGFYKAYAPQSEEMKLAETVTDTEGNFKFPPVQNYDGLGQFTKDLLLVVIYENNTLTMFNDYFATKKVYKTKVASQEDNWPYKGIFNFGEVVADTDLVEYRELKIYKLFFDSIYKYKKVNSNIINTINLAYPAGHFSLGEDNLLSYLSGQKLIKLKKSTGNMILTDKFTIKDIDEFVYNNIFSFLKYRNLKK